MNVVLRRNICRVAGRESIHFSNYLLASTLHSPCYSTSVGGNKHFRKNYRIESTAKVNSCATYRPYIPHLYSNSRNFHIALINFDKSKVEDSLKEKQKNKDAITPLSKDEKAVVVKKPLRSRIWAEILHYYHGFRLLGLDVKIALKSLWKLFCGKSLTRRENNQFKRAVSDMFRLAPFSVFIIIPFAELLLPFVVAIFPSLLPSTFESKNDREARLKKQLVVKLEMAKFMQDAVENIAVRSKKSSKKNEAVNNFLTFIEKIRNTSEEPTNDDILKHAKLFEDEVTLDSMSREQLLALCRLIQVPAVGSNNLLRYMLQMKLNSIHRDDQVIQEEGIDNLNPMELQSACQARGMRALGMTTERLKSQLTQWIDLHLNHDVPSSLLLYSRVLYLPETVPVEERVKAAISALPEKATSEAGMRAAEINLERVDNTERYKVSKQEHEDIVKESKEEEQKEKQKKEEIEIKKKKEEEQVVASQTLPEEVAGDIAKVSQPASMQDTITIKEAPSTTDDIAVDLSKDKAIVLDANKTEIISDGPILVDKAKAVESEEITKEEIDALDKAIDKIVGGKKPMEKTKSDLKDLKEDFEEYEEDVKRLSEEIVKEKDEIISKDIKANTRLQKSIKRLITDMEVIVNKIEKVDETAGQQQEIQDDQEVKKEKIPVTELVDAVKSLQGVSEDKLNYIASILDQDKNGEIELNEALTAIQAIDKEDVAITPSQLHHLVTLVKEEREGNLKMKEMEENKICKESDVSNNTKSSNNNTV